MPSAVYIFLDAAHAGSKWESFRRSIGLVADTDRPWSYRGDGVLVLVDGEARAKSLDPATGLPPPGAPASPDVFDRITVSGTTARDDGEVAATVASIASEFPCEIACDPELDHLVVPFPRRAAWDDGPPLPTDSDGAWLTSDGIRVARVPAGRAVVRPTGDLVLLETEGIPRASFRRVRDAVLFAGRCRWTAWEGPLPEGGPLHVGSPS